MSIDLGLIAAVLGAIFLVALMLLVTGVWRAWRTWPRKIGHCPCGYSLAGLEAELECPECGHRRRLNEEPHAGQGCKQHVSRLGAVLLLGAPVIIGAACLAVVLSASGNLLRGLLPMSLCLIPYVLHCAPILFVRKRLPPWRLVAVAVVPALVSAAMMGGAFAIDWTEPPSRDDVFYPYTLFILAALFALPWSALSSAAIVWWVVWGSRSPGGTGS